MTDISVVIPLDDARGDALEHLRTWSEEQTLPRERYQLVLVSDGTDPAGDERIAAALEPHDLLLTRPGAGLIDLWDEGVAAADCEWLMLTENHVEAKPHTLERALEGIGADPELDAASIDHGHITPNSTGELGARWFDRVYGEWYSPGNWRRLNLAGYLIRREVYREVGGLEDRYGLFAAPLLSARLAESEARVAHFPDAGILHVQNEDIAEHHGHTENYARGECEARLSLDHEFAERYFGHQHLVWNRRGLEPSLARPTLRALAREGLRELPRRPREAWGLLEEIRPRLLPALAGPRGELALTRSKIAWDERVASSERVPTKRRFATFVRAHALATRAGQLEWIMERRGDAGDRVSEGEAGILALGEGALIGMHGLEAAAGRSFRWSEPVLTVRVEPAPEPRQLRIDTGGLRGPLEGCLIAAYAGGRRLDAGAAADGHWLIIAVPPGASQLTLLIRRLRAPGDARRLGLPVFSVALSGHAAPSRAAASAVAQPVG